MSECTSQGEERMSTNMTSLMRGLITPILTQYALSGRRDTPILEYQAEGVGDVANQMQ